MLPFAYYILKTILCSSIFLGYYWLFLRNRLFHGYNRFYLLASVIISLAIPLPGINIFYNTDITRPELIKMLSAVDAGDDYIAEVISQNSPDNITTEQILLFFYLGVCSLFFIRLVRELWKVRRLLNKSPAIFIDNVHLIKTKAPEAPFSFFKFIFWNELTDIATKTGQQIFKHELAHMRGKHSHDKIFINLALVIFWCNPFFWLIRRELNMIHEFIADEQAIENNKAADFAAMILQTAYPGQSFSLTNNFYNSPIKRRLIMITKKHQPAMNFISRVLALLVLLFAFAAFTIKVSSPASLNRKNEGRSFIVVVDAGHGGMDAGAKAVDGTLEKNINLALAKKIAAVNRNADIRIILLRETDLYQSPQEKTKLAEKLNAQLLVSVHAGFEPKISKPEQTGLTVSVARNEFVNSTKSKLLASSVIQSFKQNYNLPVISNPLQRKTGIWILQEAKCPAILIEAGYLSNKKDVAYLKSDQGEEQFAKNVLEAIERYFSQESPDQ